MTTNGSPSSDAFSNDGPPALRLAADPGPDPERPARRLRIERERHAEAHARGVGNQRCVPDGDRSVSDGRRPLPVGLGSAVGSAAGSPRPSPAVPIDPTLLSILPATVGGQTISEVPEVEAGIVTDPSLVANATGLAVALGVDLSSGEFAYIAVIRLKPLVFSNAFYLSWRQSYDQGACSQSNGVESTSTTTIAGRQVFVGTCAGGASTYHIHLAAPDRLVSITSVGTSHYGALVLAGLTP